MKQRDACGELSSVVAILVENGRSVAKSVAKKSKDSLTTHRIAPCVCWEVVTPAFSIKVPCCTMHQGVVFHWESVLF